MTTSNKPRVFWVYTSKEYPSIYAFENKQPEYMMKSCDEYKCLSVDKDLDSYIYFIQHQADITLKDLKKKDELLRECERAIKYAEAELRRHAQLWHDNGYELTSSRCQDPYKEANSLNAVLQKLREVGKK